MAKVDPSISSGDCFAPAARQALADAIEEAGGNEVFFFGTLENGTLTEVEVIARGDRASVPVFLERAGDHHVLIHNHPGGDLTPSRADMSIASDAGMRGLGFFIIDDQARRVYRVVEPFAGREEHALDEAEIDAIFRAGGQLDQAIPAFEEREGQRQLALQVARSFNGRRITACEAGTGVGKSFAYLVPAILWAARNNSRVIVSTQTIALSEQLVHKDLPLLSRVLDVDFEYALIKGRGNYICRRKADELRRQPDLYRDAIPGTGEDRNWVEEIQAKIETAREGSKAELDGVPPDDVWDLFQSTGEQSLKARCPHYSECFFYNARRSAARAAVLVVNHHLFFADLSVRRTVGNQDADLVIPGYKRVVFDEAHRIEEVAAQHLGGGLTRIGVLQRIGRLASRSGKGRLMSLLATLAEHGCQQTRRFVETEVLDRIGQIRGAVVEAFQSVDGRVRGGEAGDPDARRSEVMERIGAEAGDVALSTIEEPLILLRDELLDLKRTFKRAWNHLLDEPFEPESRYEGAIAELRSATQMMDQIVGNLDLFLAPEKGMLTWVECRAGRRGNTLLKVAPIRVAEILAKSLYESTDSIVMTSATLSVSGGFDFLSDRLGWGLTEKHRFEGKSFDSPFDFERQVMLVLPDDLPPPDDRAFEQALTDLCRDSVRAARGRTLILFTSHWLMRRVAEKLEPDLRDFGYPCFVQGRMPQSELLSRFRSAGNGVLFGNQAFWEGIDLPGDALSCVIITKLPFRVPSHPLEKGRAEELKSRGKNPFAGLTVPQAVLALKQGFGRLIRTEQDRGAVVIADTRILTKSYGRNFLASLPRCREVRGPWDALRLDMMDFFREEDS